MRSCLRNDMTLWVWFQVVPWACQLHPRCQTCLQWGWAMVGHNSTIFWSRSLLHHFVNISMQNVQLWSDQTSLVCLGSASTNITVWQNQGLLKVLNHMFQVDSLYFSIPTCKVYRHLTLYVRSQKPQINLLFLFCAIPSYTSHAVKESLRPTCSQDEGGGVSPTVAMLSGRLQGRTATHPRMLCRMVGRHTLNEVGWTMVQRLNEIVMNQLNQSMTAVSLFGFNRLADHFGNSSNQVEKVNVTTARPFFRSPNLPYQKGIRLKI